MKNKLFFSSMLLVSGGIIAMDQAGSSQHTIDFSQLNQEVEKTVADMDRLLIGVYSGDVCTQQEIDSSLREPSAQMCSHTAIHELLGSLSIAPEDEEPARPHVRERSPSLDRNRSCSPESFGNRMQSEELTSVQESLQEELRKNHYQRKLDELHDDLRAYMRSSSSYFTSETKRHELIDIRDTAKLYADLAQDFPGLYSRFNCIMCDADRQLNSLTQR